MFYSLLFQSGDRLYRRQIPTYNMYKVGPRAERVNIVCLMVMAQGVFNTDLEYKIIILTLEALNNPGDA